MPRLWNDTIEAHRRGVRDAILDASAALADHGLGSLKMTHIAEKTGIGRATLYKYFPDVETILFAWHERQIADHLKHLCEVRDAAGTAEQQLAAVLEAYALMSHESRGRHGTELAALLHGDDHVLRAERELRGMIRDLLTAAAAAGAVRRDLDADQLAGYCLHALTAATGFRSKAAVRQLLGVTLDGLRPR